MSPYPSVMNQFFSWDGYEDYIPYSNEFYYDDACSVDDGYGYGGTGNKMTASSQSVSCSKKLSTY